MSMNYTKLNNSLKDLTDIKLRKISSFKPEDYDNEKNDGQTSERIDIYDLEQDDLFLKVVITSDSYGDEKGITSIQFVKPIIKSITDYQSV